MLKLSGEALMGEQNYGIDTNVAESVAQEIKAVHALGVESCDCRRRRQYFSRSFKIGGKYGPQRADYIGMLATVMNAVVLQDALEQTRMFLRG